MLAKRSGGNAGDSDRGHGVVSDHYGGAPHLSINARVLWWYDHSSRSAENGVRHFPE